MSTQPPNVTAGGAPSGGFDNSFANLVPWQFNLQGFCQRVNAFGELVENIGSGGTLDLTDDVLVAATGEPTLLRPNTDVEIAEAVESVPRGLGGAKSRDAPCTACGGNPPPRERGGCRTCRNSGRVAGTRAPRATTRGVAGASASAKSTAGNRTGEVNYYTEPLTELTDLEVLAATTGNTRASRVQHAMRQLPNFRETQPGVYAGKDINRSLLPDEVPLRVDYQGFIFGVPYSAIVQQRIDQLNGFDLTVNNYSYDTGLSNSYGSFRKPFVKDNFLIDMGDGRTQVWSNRIINDTAETQGLCLWVNGMPGRTIYLVRRPQPYYFHFRLQKLNPNFPLPNPSSITNMGAYFSTDLLGGNASSSVNFGTHPPIFPGTNIIWEGNGCWLRIDNSWPDTLFLQSEAAPYGGCKLVIVGAGCC